jgi:hypothetical protein
MIRCLVTIRFLVLILITAITTMTCSNLLIGNIALHARTVEAQTEKTTTTNSSNDTRQTTADQSNMARLEGSQPDVPPIQGTGIPDDEAEANPAPQAPISEIEVRARENETREGTGAFTNFTNTTGAFIFDIWFLFGFPGLFD